MADIKFDIRGDTKGLEKDIQKTVNKNYSINLKTTGSQPLGRITGQLSEFNKSLEASNARVIAFGASAGLIYGLESAFVSLATSVIEVQKSLQDINVILNVSSSELEKFGSGLFDIAKNTGQTFQSVAQAATEFSRQGLTLEETLKRTSEALILSRLSGLDAQKSVEALTAAVNSYAGQAVTATEVVNKFANVDAAFAVSSADLAEALARVGSSASQSGVSLNELIGIVTSAQQTTARGGAVIGNSLKTIFTRLQRGKVVSLLESLGIETKGPTGELKSTIQLLADLGKVYDTLGTQQQASVAEAVGGVFQINILKAALADLGKEYSIYGRAVDVAANSTNQAILRNEELNKTYAAQLNALRENVTELSASVGGKVLGPSFERLVGGANAIFGGIKESDANGFGATLANGILSGLGQVLAGPGLALIGGVLIKLFKDFSVYASGSVRELLGLNTASKQQAEIQKSINGIIAQNPGLLKLMTQNTEGLNQAAAQLLASFRSQTLELQKQESSTKRIAAQLYSSGVRVVGGVPTTAGKAATPKTKAEGYIPAFSKESKDIKRGVGGARPGDKPLGPMVINGEPTVINSGEKLIQNFEGSGETAILTRDMQKSMGMSNGYIPNFAELKPGKQKKIIDAGKKYGYLVPAISENGSRYSGGQLPGLETPDVKILPSIAVPPVQSKIQSVSDSLESQVKDSVVGAAANYTSQLQPLGRTVTKKEIEQGFGKTAGAKGALQGAIGAAFEVGITTALDYRAAQRKEGGDFDIRGGANLARVQELFGTNVNIADFKVGVSKDNVESFYGKVLKENKIGAFSPAEKTKNAVRQAEIEASQKHPDWFTNKGVLKTQDVPPETVRKRQAVIDRLRSKILKTRYSNFSKGYIPNFANIKKSNLPLGVRGRANYGGPGSKPSIELGTGASTGTLAHELFHQAYSRSTFRNAEKNPSIGKFLSSPGKYAGVKSIISSSIFKGLDERKLYSSLGLNPVQLDFDGKNPSATYSGPKAVDEIVTRIQEKVFKNKGNLEALSIEEKAFVKNLEREGIIRPNRFANISKRSKEGSKFRSLVDSKFSSVMGTKASGEIPNFATRRVGYLDGDVLDDPRYKATVEAEMKKLGIKGGVPEYHKYLGDLVKKSRKSGDIKKFTGIFGVPGAGKSTMMLGGKSAQKADNAKARQTQRIPILTPQDISRVDEVIDTRASLVGTSRALQGGYWSGLDRLMVMSSSTTEEQNEIKRRRNLRDAQIKEGTSATAFGRTAGTSQGANLDSGYIEAMALSILGPNKTRIMGISPNFKLKRKKGEELPLVEKKKIGLSYGAFSPSTRGHLEMMEMAKKKGIPPEDFIVAVSREGGKIDAKDPHSFRTAIFDQSTRKYLAKKTFTGANVIGADPNLFMGGVPSMLEVDPKGKQRRFLSAKKGSTAFVGSDKQEKDLVKYKDAGYDVEVGERTAGISGTDARAAIISADSKLISKIFADHVVSTVNDIAPKIRNRANIFPEILKRVDSKIDKQLAPILAQLSTLPGRITKTTPEDVAMKINGLREQRDKFQKLKQNYPVRILRRLGRLFPEKYGVPTAATGYIPNFADPLKAAVDRELEQSGLPKSQIYLSQKDALITKQNPGGLGVFNKRDEGSSVKENRAIRSRSNGYIPNFADPIQTLTPQIDTSGLEASVSDVENSASSLSTTVGALATQLGSLALITSLNKDGYKESLAELTKSNVDSAKANLKAAKDMGLTKESRRFFAGKVMDAKGGTFGQKATAGLKSGGTSLTFAAPILAETIGGAIPDTTKTGRVAKAGASALGNIGAFAGTGAMIGSAIPGVGTAIGAGVGAAAGALLSIPDVVGELSTDFPELSAAAKKATEALNKLQTSNSTLLQSYQQYTDAMASGDNVIIQKAQEQLQVALLSSTEQQRSIIQSAKTLAEAQELLAQEEIKRAKEAKNAQIAAELADTNISQVIRTPVGGGPGIMAFSEQTASDKEGQAKIGAALKREITAGGTLKNKSSEDILSKKIDTTGLKPEEIISKINGVLGEFQVPQPIIDIVNKTGDAGIAANFLNSVLDDLATASSQASVAMNAVVKNMESIRPIMDSIKEQFSALGTAIERNINYVQRAVGSQNKLNNIQSGFDRQAAVSENVGFPKQVLETIIGANAAPTQEFAFKEGLANINEERISASQQTRSTASESVLGKVFDVIRKQTVGENSAINQVAGIQDPNTLENISSDVVNSLQNIDFAKIGSEINNAVTKTTTGGEDIINQDEVVKVVSSLLSESQVSQDIIESTNTEIIKSIQESNDALNESNTIAKNQEKLLTQQTSQQMALLKLQQALNSFGGINSYLNPTATGPEGFDNPFMSKGQSEKKRAEIGVQPVSTAAKGVADILATNPFKFNNRESLAARKESIPDLGRNFLQLVTSLKERTGGLYTPTAGSRGLQYAEQGRAMGINQELASLRDLAGSKGVKGTGVETEIKNAIKSVQDFGVDKIAKIQVAQAAGTGVPKELIDIATQLKSPAEQQLASIAPGLKESLANIMTTGEPQVDALNSLNAIQANSYQALVNIETSIAELVGVLAGQEGATKTDVPFKGENLDLKGSSTATPKVDLNTSLNVGGINISVASTQLDSEIDAKFSELSSQVKALASVQGVKFSPTNLQ